jgi:hypothetical protein
MAEWVESSRDLTVTGFLIRWDENYGVWGSELTRDQIGDALADPPVCQGSRCLPGEADCVRTAAINGPLCWSRRLQHISMTLPTGGRLGVLPVSCRSMPCPGRPSKAVNLL